MGSKFFQVRFLSRSFSSCIRRRPQDHLGLVSGGLLPRGGLSSGLLAIFFSSPHTFDLHPKIQIYLMPHKSSQSLNQSLNSCFIFKNDPTCPSHFACQLPSSPSRFRAHSPPHPQPSTSSRNRSPSPPNRATSP